MGSLFYVNYEQKTIDEKVKHYFRKNFLKNAPF